MATLMASHTKSVLSASNSVFPGKISPAIAAEWVMPEHPMVSTKASSIMPFFTFKVSLQVPCWGAHQPTPVSYTHLKISKGLLSKCCSLFKVRNVALSFWPSAFPKALNHITTYLSLLSTVFSKKFFCFLSLFLFSSVVYWIGYQ